MSIGLVPGKVIGLGMQAPYSLDEINDDLGSGNTGCTRAADITGDDLVDVLDLLVVLGDWGQTGGPADINDDGVVDVLDLLEVLASWGPCD